MHFILFLVNSLESPSSTRLLSSILNFHFFVQNETVEQQNFINNRTRSYLEEHVRSEAKKILDYNQKH